MKTVSYKLLYILAFVCGISLLSCDESNKGDLIVDVDASIVSFKANNVSGTINDEAQTITIYSPWSHDLTSMTTQIEVPEGATVTPANASNVDLSKGVKYRVINGNLYWDYTVKAEHSKMLTFTIGNYKGKIDNTTGEIIVKYPIGQPLTALSPVFTTTPGAKVDPQSGTAHDFTNPIKYTMSYMGETFEYTVTIVPTSFEPIAFLGTAESALAITNEDEKAAYKWFSENVADFTYISFSDIKDEKVNVKNYKAIWWHLDGDDSNLPSEANAVSVTNKLKDYYQNGGSFFFSSWAIQYVASLGIAKDGKVANNMWGQGNTPFVIGDDWGICFKGNESHPIFDGLAKKAGSNYVAFLLGKGVKAKAHNALWNFEWGDYANNIPAWTANNGAINLASFHWNEDMNRAGIFEYPKTGNSGRTICIGLESYDWYNEDNSAANTYIGNIELLTSNILEYLSR